MPQDLMVVEAPPLAQDEAEIFEEGQHPQGTYTAADLDQIATDYNAAVHEAPSITDHSVEGAIQLGQKYKGPAYGWVDRVRPISVKLANGEERRRLVAHFAQIPDSFREMYRDGRVKKPSAEFYKGFPSNGRRYLAGVAWLGAQPPQVKGLRPAHFAQAEGVETEVAEAPFEGRARFAEAAPRGEGDDMTQEQIDAAVKAAMGTVKTELTSHFAEERTKIEAGFETKLAAQAALTTAATERAQKLEDDLKAERARGRKAEFERFAEAQITENRLAPGQKDKAVDLMVALDGTNVKEGEKDRPATELFREVLGSFGPRVPTGEHPAFRAGKVHDTLTLKAGDGKTTMPFVIPDAANPESVRFAEQAARMENAESFEAALIATSHANPNAYRP